RAGGAEQRGAPAAWDAGGGAPGAEAGVPVVLQLYTQREPGTGAGARGTRAVPGNPAAARVRGRERTRNHPVMANGLKVGVAGVGSLGRHHARLLRDLPDAHLVGIHDTDAERMRAVGEALGVATFDALEALLDRVEALVVAVPTAVHEPVARAAVGRGVHVLIEKPIAPSLDAADRILEAAERGGALVQIGHVERFNGALRACEPYLEEPLFVECHRLAPFAPRGTDVAVVLDLMIHDLDLVLSLVRKPVRSLAAAGVLVPTPSPDVAYARPGFDGGPVSHLTARRGTDVAVVLDLMIHDLDLVLSLVRKPVRSLAAAGVPVLTPSPDIANARLEFEGGAVANLTASRVSMERMRKIRFFQRSGYISLDLAAGVGEFLRLRPGVELVPGRPLQAAGIEELVERIELRGDGEEPLRCELASFVAAVQGRGAVAVTGTEARNALAVALDIVGRIEDHVAHRAAS